jgi:hypothetical protein
VSVPPELMQKMMAQGPAGAPPTAPGAPPPQPGQEPTMGGGPGGQGPAASPMSKPQDKRGLKAAAQTNLHIATNMLEEALPAFGSESPEGGKILSALKILGGLVGKRDTSDLVPAEILQMVKRMPQMGGGTSAQKQIMQIMQQQKPQPAPSP